METTPKKVAVVGFDCAEPHLIERHIREGHLPNFKKLFEEGVLASNCLAPFPTITPPNWATIATGAWPYTHGITDFHVHIPGNPLDYTHSQEAFSSNRCKAEFIWDAIDKAGKKSIVVNYPGAWPNHMKNGIVIGGSGLSIGENRDGMEKLNSTQMLCADQLVTTGYFPLGIKVKLEEKKSWKNTGKAGADPLGAAFELTFPAAAEKPAPTTWYVLAAQGKDGYDRVSLSPDTDFNKAFFTISVGEWSKKVFTTIKMADGSEREVFFRAKLVELSEDAQDLRLLITSLCQTEGWANPLEICKEIASEEGIFGHGGGVLGVSIGWFDLETFSEIHELHDLYLGDTVTTLLTKHPWDLFYMHSHPIDWMYHIIMTDMDPDTCRSKEAYEKAWATHLRIHQSQDKMLGRIIEAAGKDTLFVLVSDHGAVADGAPFNPHAALEKAGLLVQSQTKTRNVAGINHESMSSIMSKATSVSKTKDMSKTKAVGQRTVHIYINLKGRDPEGIVDPADYEKVQQEIIDALYTYVDPNTGRRPVALALSNKDARIIGLTGPDAGDIIYAIYPEFGGQHGAQLPNAHWGIGDLKPLLALSGPGIKKNHRLERSCWLTDIVPTICYLMDWPIPAQAEGAVLYQALKKPNFKADQINKLKDGLARMETALQRGERQPWDKHECA